MLALLALGAAVGLIYLLCLRHAVLDNIGNGHWPGLGAHPALLWLLLAMLALTLLAGGWAARFGFERQDPGPMARRELWLLLALLALGGVMRLWRLGELPNRIGHDLILNCYVALELMERLAAGEYWPVLPDYAIGNETALLYLQGLLLKLLGITPFSMRLAGALLGTLTLLPVYLLGRELYSPRMAQISTLLLALSPWHVYLSRESQRAMQVPLFVALVLLFLVRGLKAGGGRRAWRNFILCGVCVGAGLHTYEVFRLFPLVVTACLLRDRARQQRLRQGFGELLVVAGYALLVALPIVAFAALHPEEYFWHIGNNTAEAPEVSFGAQLWDNLTGILGYMAAVVPLGLLRPEAIQPGLVQAPLVMFGLLGLWLARRRPGPRPDLGWLPLALTLVLLFVPLIFAQRNLYFPRRFVGLVVPFYLLAGGAALGLLRAAAGRVGAVGARVLGAAGVVLLLTGVPSTLLGLEEDYDPNMRVINERVMRLVLAESRQREVYVAPGVIPPDQTGHSAVQRLLRRAPRVHLLPTSWPLPAGRLGRDLSLVTGHDSWWRALGPLAGARRSVQQLWLPNYTPFKRWLVVYRAPAARLLALRLPAASHRAGFSGQILVPRSGRYQLALRDGQGGELLLDGVRHPLEGLDRPLTLGLSAGLHDLACRPRAPDTLLWLGPGMSDWRRIPPGLLWRLPASPRLPRGPAVAPDGPALEGPFEYTLPLDPEADSGFLELAYQDLAVGPGGVAIARIARNPVGLWTRWRPGRLTPLLRDSAGDLLLYRPDVPLYLQSTRPAELSLAWSTAGIFLLDRQQRSVTRFDRRGRALGQLEGPLEQPVDVAASGQKVFVADAGRQALLQFSAADPGQARELVRGVLPVSVDARGDRLAYLDRRQHQLVLLRTSGARRRVVVQLGRVTRGMRVALSASGLVAVSQPRQRRLQLHDAAGRLLGRAGDPSYLSWLLPAETQGLAAVQWGLQRDELLVLGRKQLLLRFDLR